MAQTWQCVDSTQQCFISDCAMVQRLNNIGDYCIPSTTVFPYITTTRPEENGTSIFKFYILFYLFLTVIIIISRCLYSKNRIFREMCLTIPAVVCCSHQIPALFIVMYVLAPVTTFVLILVWIVKKIKNMISEFHRRGDAFDELSRRVHSLEVKLGNLMPMEVEQV